MTQFDPENMPVEQLKTFGLWGPNYEQMLLAPYVKRLKCKNKRVVIVGVGRGNVLIRFGEELAGYSIIGANFEESDEDKSVLKTNQLFFDLNVVDDVDEFSVLYVHGTHKISEKLSRYYDKLVSGGIVAGTHHTEKELKDQLSNFRMHKCSSKITCPINVLDKNVWFWYKQ